MNKSNIQHLIAATTLLLLLASCKPQHSTNLADYYYPMDELEQKMEYHYKSTNNEQLPPYHWVYESTSYDGKLILTGDYIDHEGLLKQNIKEERRATQMEAIGYKVYDVDSLGKWHKSYMTISDKAVYPLGEAANAKILKFKTEWTDPLDSLMHNSITRGRIFQQFTSYNFDGKEVPCAEFLMVETIVVDQEGQGEQKLETETRELFAEGIGLVYYQKMVGEIEVAYELVEVNRIDR